MSGLLRSKSYPQGVEIQLIQGDITTVPTEGIVNPANSLLTHGGGLAGILARKAGPTLQAESTAWVKQYGPVDHASPAHTSAGDLPFKAVIHAVGPVWGSGNEREKLRAAVKGSLSKAAELGLRSVSLPAISTGIFGYPVSQAAEVILSAARDFIQEEEPAPLERAVIVVYNNQAAAAFTEAWKRVFG